MNREIIIPVLLFVLGLLVGHAVGMITATVYITPERCAWSSPHE